MSDQHDFSPVRAFDENGLPVPGAQAFFYIPGTTAPIDVFADEAETILHPRPVLANAAGVFPAIWCSQLVKAVVLSPEGATLPGYPMEIAMRSFGEISGASQVSFSPTADIVATNVQDAVEVSFANLSADIAGLGALAELDTITTAQIAPAALRTRAEGVGTPLDTEMPTVNAMTGHVADVAAGKRNSAPDFVTGPFPLVASDTRSVGHGLGAAPRDVQLWLNCVNARAGMVPGERYGPLAPSGESDGADVGYGASVNASTLRTAIASSTFTIINVATGVRANLLAFASDFTYEVHLWR